MSFTYGFYNSIDGDRTYDADQFGDMFSGLITDGVYASIGDAFMVTSGGTLSVVVGTGRAWFNKTWNWNSTRLTLNLELADLLLPRYDMVVLEVDKNSFSRRNSIKVITGTPSANPQKPTYSRTSNVYQYPLAYISVRQNQEIIEPKDIEVTVGRDPCPFVKGMLESADITPMYQQWQQQFTDWFAELQSKLSGDVATNLQKQVDDLKTSVNATVADIKTVKEDLSQVVSGLGCSPYIAKILTGTYWETPSNCDFRYPIIFVGIGGGGAGGCGGGGALMTKPSDGSSPTYYNPMTTIPGGGGGGSGGVAYCAIKIGSPSRIQFTIGAGGRKGVWNGYNTTGQLMEGSINTYYVKTKPISASGGGNTIVTYANLTASGGGAGGQTVYDSIVNRTYILGTGGNGNAGGSGSKYTNNGSLGSSITIAASGSGVVSDGNGYMTYGVSTTVFTDYISFGGDGVFSKGGKTNNLNNTNVGFGASKTCVQLPRGIILSGGAGGNGGRISLSGDGGTPSFTNSANDGGAGALAVLYRIV